VIELVLTVWQTREIWCLLYTGSWCLGPDCVQAELKAAIRQSQSTHQHPESTSHTASCCPFTIRQYDKTLSVKY